MKARIAISGWGNIGKALAKIHVEEVKAGDAGMELAGIIRRNAKNAEGGPEGIPVTDDVSRLSVRPDVVLCAAPSHCVMEDVQKFLRVGISTVDCFDNHREIPGWRERLDVLAKENRVVSITASGWDPGFDSVFRALSGLIVTENEPVTTFGPGRSMGHTTTVKSLHPGIKDAVSITLPGEKPGFQRREVYIQLAEGSAGTDIKEKIQQEIMNHPNFRDDDTQVRFVTSIEEYDTESHGGVITREGGAARVEVKLFGSNALMTAAAMYGAARAVVRALEAGNYGCRTLAEIPPLDFVKGKTVVERLAKIKY